MSTGMATICVVLIVRNEERRLWQCLEAAEKICDRYVIVDTGSDDRTIDLAQAWLFTRPGDLYRREWHGFAHNRTEALGLAGGSADYLLMLDADMILHAPDPMPELTADVYHGRILGDRDYSLPMLIRGDRNWAYRGVAHSYLVSDREFKEEILPGLAVEDHSSTGRPKLLRDLEALSAEHASNPLDSRTCFYLAQTYYDLDRFQEAIVYYRARANMDGWAEETFYARYMLGVLLCEHVSFAQGAQELLKAWEMRPSRIEPLRALANVANNVADKAPYPDDKLFIRRNAYKRQPSGLTPADVSAVLVTRGNVDLAPILATLPYKDIVIWDNSKREDLKVFGRYLALHEIKNEIVYFQDDDVIFTEHQRLLDLYEPGVVVANMDDSWVQACGYHDLVMMGAGSICDRAIAGDVFHQYLDVWPYDDEFILECDFVFGTLVNGKKVDLGYTARPFSDDADRLYTQPWQWDKKALVRQKARLVRDGGSGVEL